MSFWLQPIRPYEFTAYVYDSLLWSILAVKPLSTFIFAHPRLRRWLTHRQVTERIIEMPFVLSRLPPPPARVLDVGACESPLALMLASLGYAVTAVDLRPYPFSHPRLTSRVVDITQARLSGYDVVVCLSTLEHVGLSVYGGRETRDGDKLAVRSMYAALKLGGRLLLTTPVASEDKSYPGWRAYSVSTLLGFMRRFKSLNCRYGIKNSSGQWSVHTRRSADFRSHGHTPTTVALIEAVK